MSNENISALAFLGIIGMLIYKIADVPVWVGVVSAGALLIAAVTAMSRGWFFGWTREDQPADHEPVPVPAAAVGPQTFLVGSQIVAFGSRFTVLDDSAPSVAAAVATGGRAVVTAANEHGTIGLLFLGFTASGGVVEAATQDGVWEQAQLVH